MPTRRGLFLGRFQPYHNGHQAVIEHLVQHGEFEELIIAVGSAQWSHTLRDPFTAGERILMITQALAPLQMTSYALPIEDIERHSLYVAHICTLVPAFTAVYSNNPLVQRLFAEAGIEVRPLPYVDRHSLDGTKIRQLMIEGEAWRPYVPAAVATVIDDVQGVARIRQIARTDKHP